LIGHDQLLRRGGGAFCEGKSKTRAADRQLRWRQSLIQTQANRRATSLNDSRDKFKIHLLLGKPADSQLQGTFVKSQNILNKMPGKAELIREDEAEAFAEEFEKEVRQHEKTG